MSAAPLLDEDPSIRREQLLALLQASPAQFTLHRGPDHVFVMNNAAHQHLTGGRKLVGVPFAEAMPELVAQGILAHLDAVYATGEAWRATPLRVFLTGSAGLEERWFDLAILPVHDDAGHIEGVATICSDVTDLVRTRRELGVMSARMMQLWESNVLGICDTDAEQNVVDANESLLKLLGLRREDLSTGITWSQLASPARAIAEGSLERERSPAVVDLVRSDGRRVPALVGSTRPDADGKTMRYVVDRSAERRAQERLSFLHRIAVASSCAHTPEEVGGVVVEHLCQWPGVSGAIVYLRLDGSLKLLGHFGLLHDSQQAPEGLRDDAETILASMMKARAPIWLSGEGFDALLPHLAERRARTKNGTFALLPLIIQDEPAGMLGLWAADHDGFIDEDRELMMALANQIALTLERTILSRSEAAAREALARSEERMRHAFDAASLGAFSYEIATGATTFDAQMYAHWGLPFGRHIELSELRKRVHPDDWNQWDAAYVEARLRPEGRFDFVFRRVDEQGQVVRHLRCAGRTQFDGDRAVQVSGLMQDVSDRWAYEEELRRRAEVEEQLVGIVSHDLRSPLSAIVLLAGALKGDVSDRPNALRAVDRLTRSADRVSRMVNDLLDFTQARLGGGIPMRKAEIDLAPVLDETIDLLRTEHPARTILFERDATLLGTWDGDRLAQVAQNLVKNALAYSDAGTPVTVRAARQGDDVALDVHNHGEPIEQARLADLFLPLTRATSEGAAKRSIGLGLFIVERIVSAHGGRIEVTSSRDDGTRFVVALPVTPP